MYVLLNTVIMCSIVSDFENPKSFTWYCTSCSFWILQESRKVLLLKTFQQMLLHGSYIEFGHSRWNPFQNIRRKRNCKYSASWRIFLLLDWYDCNWKLSILIKKWLIKDFQTPLCKASKRFANLNSTIRIER